MGKLFYVLVIVVLIFTSSCSNSTNNKKGGKSNVEMDKKVSALLSRMTLEEKVGQMTQITLDKFYNKGILDTILLREYIIQYGIGSILNTHQDKNGSIIPLSMKEWRDLQTTIQNYALQARLKVPILYGIDAIHGVTYLEGATLFPHNIAMAAARDTEIVYKAATITAKEVRACGIRWNFDPVLGVGRQPLWSRFEETFGEDTYLVSMMGRAVITGYEGDGLDKNTAVASCMKHYLGYSDPLNGKDRTPAYIPEIVLRQIFLPPFKEAVDAGTSTVMINSGSVNGIPVHANKYLLTDVLKKELGFQGLVVSDWQDIIALYDKHHVAKDNKEAVMMAVNAGIDMSMVPSDLSFYKDLVSLVKEGKVPESRIDDAVRRILKVKYRLNLFDNPFPEKGTEDYYEKPDYKQVALKAAHELITLLKNDTVSGHSVLPLSNDLRVLVAGPGANSRATLNGSWSYSWQGKDESHYPSNVLTIRQAIEEKIGKDKVINIAPAGFQKVSSQQIKDLQKYASGADVIVLCLGENSYAESPGSIDDLTLSEDQLKLAETASITGKPIILILTEGRPRIVSKIEPSMNAVLLAYRPGNLGAIAIADVLLGEVNPSGKLPYTYPRYTGNIMTYDMPVRSAPYYKPQWPFGYGLSYTTFSTSLKLNHDTLNINDTLQVSVLLKNTGNRYGELAIDLFVRDMTATMAPPMRKLRRFARVALKAGESRRIIFNLSNEDWSFIDSSLKLRIEEGNMMIMVGDKKAAFYLKLKE
ncbi:MAG: beta-glucosidase [Chlorobi bacterium]|nr:beta-glucosidase [Chlorobiota bacterium]